MPDIEFEIRMLNDGGHLSQEMRWEPTITIFFIAVFGYLLGFSGWRFLKEVKVDDVGEKPLAFLCMALMAETASCVMSLLHLLVY